MPVQRPQYDKPHGAENYDGGALDEKQQEKLNQRKVYTFKTDLIMNS